MISKGEAIQRLKKMGVAVADDQSIVTILLPSDISFTVGVKDIKEKLKSIEYEASFSIRQDKEHKEESVDVSECDSEENVDWQKEDIVTEEELQGSLLAMDDDGQFTLGGFGMDF